ncbi:hypothetical protein [Micromonospora sp. NPDC049374]|uniref:hypothetical protein n=1 Tax=Micromonospora sp. NPDC049374 TaxID=3154352 RepID=UPI00341892D3
MPNLEGRPHIPHAWVVCSAVALRIPGSFHDYGPKPRYDMWLFKRPGLPAMYWQGMLRGLV